MTVARQLLDDSKSRDNGDADDVVRLVEACMESVPHARHAEHYAKHVVEASRRRQITRIGTELANGERDGLNVEDLLKDRLATLTELAAGRKASSSTLRVRCVANVTSRPVEWLWPDLMPLGKLTLLCGDAGLGKSFVTCDLAARVSSGNVWPNTETRQPSGSVLFLASEDDVEDTIRPRLDAAGADVSRIHVIDSVCVRNRERGFSLDGDLQLLRQQIEELGDVRLLIIDPISAYCGKTDTHRNSDVRSLLSPLTDLAADHRLAIVGINHLAKRSIAESGRSPSTRPRVQSSTSTATRMPRTAD